MEAYRVSSESDPGFTLDEMKRFVAKHFDEFVNRKNSEVARESFSADFLDVTNRRGPRSARKRR